MPQQKNHTIFVNLFCYILILLLIYPKTLSVLDTASTTLTPHEFDFINQSKLLLVLFVMFIETITMGFNILILHWIYKFANLKYQLYENIYIYSLSTVISKFIDIIIPFQIAILPNLLFLLIFTFIHLKLRTLTKGQLIWILVLPVLNIIFYII